MATITKSIGTSSRDYSTITAWEADLDNTGIYTSGDDAVGECYNDTAFDESVGIDGGSTVGLNSIKLTAANGEKHDGTEGTGARIVSSTQIIFIGTGGSVDKTISFIEVDKTAAANANITMVSLTGSAGSGATNNLHACIVHGAAVSTQNYRSLKGVATGSVAGITYNVTNNIVYDITHASGGNPAGITTATGNIYIYNCTVHDITEPGGTTGSCFSVTCNDLRNCIATDCSGNDFATGTISGTESNNLSSDSTASGTGSLTGKTAANQFVSTVAGSEDLHLLSTADAVGAGVDLATTSVDINGSDRNALAATVWDIGAHQYASTASIGTSSRDYSTIALWEADLDDTTIYGAGANAVGEVYNDSSFTFSSAITIDTNVTLSSIKLTVPKSERHDGTAGTGAKLVPAPASLYASHCLIIEDPNVRVEFLEFEFDQFAGYDVFGIWLRISRGATNCDVNGCLFHSLESGSVSPALGVYVQSNVTDTRVHNNFFITMGYCIRASYAGYAYIYNNTGYGSSITNRSRVGIDYINFSSNVDIRSNIMANFQTADIDTGWTISPTTNATSDSSGQTTGITASDHFVSVVSGSEDLHLLASSSLRGAGQDLGSDYAIDIDGTNRDAFTGTTWDIGADQVYITASIGTSSRDYSTIALWEADLDDTSLYTSGDDAVGECYNDSTFALTDHITLRGGGVVGLSSVTVTAAQADRHDGTADTGVKITFNAFKAFYAEAGKDASTRIPTIVEWLDIDGQGFSRTFLIAFYDNTLNSALRNCITRGPGDQVNAYLQSYNNIAYGSSGGFLTNVNFGNNNANQYNNTIHLPVAYRVTYIGIGTVNIKNILATSDNPHPTYGLFSGDYLSSANNASNISSDGTAIGTNSKTNQPVSRQFVSTLSGSEDLHLIFKSAAIDAGVDLGTTPDGVQYDINGKDRDTENSIWDIGAHEYGDNVIFGLLRV
jgi:hypothetical protein